MRRAAALAALAALGAGCGQPPPVHEGLYAGRPRLVGLDTSPLRGRRILIDPGHGGRFDGAQGVERTREADINLGVGLYLWGLLRDAGADVHLTRHSDRDLLPDSSAALRADLAARVALLDSLRPDVFLSLHHNSNAALDRERNAIETYYKLDDEGPSYDLGRAIEHELAVNLGIPASFLLPGNYFVLRGSTATAVLGEASYLSNPATESALRLAENQKLEAEAYFLGLVDYFERGVPRLDKIEPAGDTLQAGETLRFRIQGEPGGSFDPLAAELWVDGTRMPAALDLARAELALPAGAGLGAGSHEVVVRARGARGNAARPWSGRIVVHVPPASVVLEQEPDPAPPGCEVRLRLRLLGPAGQPVADGSLVRLAGTGFEILESESTTRRGDLLARVHLPAGGPPPRLHLQAEALALDLPLHVQAGGVPMRFVSCVDAVRGGPIADAWASCGRGSGPERSDRLGLLRLRPGCDSLRVERRGYVPWRGLLPADGVLRLEPLYGGRLHDLCFVLDPGGDGLQASRPAAGISSADIALDVCRLLGEMLEAAGARATLARGPSDPVPDVERVRLAQRLRADWYVRVEASLEPRAAAAVLHYPGSAAGERLARSVASWLERRLQQGAVAVRSDTRFVLQQTPCPSVLVLLPGPAAGEDAADLADTRGERRRAYGLFVGLRTALDPQAAAQPALTGSLDLHGDAGASGLVVLDSAEILPPGLQGAYRFECVAPGRHLLAAILPGVPARETEVLVAPAGADPRRASPGAAPHP